MYCTLHEECLRKRPQSQGNSHCFDLLCTQIDRPTSCSRETIVHEEYPARHLEQEISYTDTHRHPRHQTEIKSDRISSNVSNPSATHTPGHAPVKTDCAGFSGSASQLEATYGYLTPDLWKPTNHTKSPFQVESNTENGPKTVRHRKAFFRDGAL